MLGFEVLERRAENCIVEIGPSLDGFGPYSFLAGFIDESVDNLLFGGKTAITVVRGLISILHTSRPGDPGSN